MLKLMVVFFAWVLTNPDPILQCIQDTFVPDDDHAMPVVCNTLLQGIGIFRYVAVHTRRKIEEPYVTPLFQCFSCFHYMRGNDEHAGLLPCKGIGYCNRGLMGILHVGASKELIEYDKQRSSLVQFRSHFFYPQHL